MGEFLNKLGNKAWWMVARDGENLELSLGSNRAVVLKKIMLIFPSNLLNRITLRKSYYCTWFELIIKTF